MGSGLPRLARVLPGSLQSRPSPVLIFRLAPPFSLPLVPLAPSHLINTGALMVLINLAAAAGAPSTASDPAPVMGLAKPIQLSMAAVVAVTFVSALAALDLAAIVVPLFVIAMGNLMATLLLLLLETQLATGQINRRF